MHLSHSRPKEGTIYNILKSFRDETGKSTTASMFRLGTFEEIRLREGVEDAWAWIRAELERCNMEEKLAKQRKVRLELDPTKRIEKDKVNLYWGGDLVLLPLYNALGLPQICQQIKRKSRAKYDLNEILEALVMLRIKEPGSKIKAFNTNKTRIRKTKFALEDVYRALSLLSSHIDDIQAHMWKHSQRYIKRNTRVIYYDCTNYYFEIEDNDPDYVDKETGEVVFGLRKRGHSKENRPNPIVQMGLLMDQDGIPLSFIIFPGNESEQPSLQQIEKVVTEKFGLNEFIVSTDAGLASESNRHFNMEEGREYIAVQSIPSLPKADQDMALDPKGWRIISRDPNLPPIDPANPKREIFDLTEIDFTTERKTRFYKEILVEKRLNNKADTSRMERIIVTYSHDYALYLKHKRSQRLQVAEKIVKTKQVAPRQSQQDPRKYVETTYITPDGQKANKISMAINQEVVDTESRFDGFYAYGTSLDDSAIDILRARSFHYEIEHLFRTTKTFLEARPVYLQRQDRIRSHFLTCFIAMTILKMLQKQINAPQYSIDQIIDTIKNWTYTYHRAKGYQPNLTRTDLTDAIQKAAGVITDTEIIEWREMNKLYRNLK